MTPEARNHAHNPAKQTNPGDAATLSLPKRAHFLSFKQKLDLVRAPFNEENLSRLGLASINNHSGIMDSVRNLFKPPSLRGDYATYDTWNKVCNFLIAERKESIGLSNAALWDKLLHIAEGSHPNFERFAQSQWVPIFAQVISIRAKVTEFFEAAGARRNTDGTFEQITLDNNRELLTNIIGERAHLIPSARIEATPLGIILYCDKETLTRLHGEMGVEGLNLREVKDRSWDGLINIVHDPIKSKTVAAENQIEWTVTHELRHAAQLCLDTATDRRVLTSTQRLHNALAAYIRQDSPRITVSNLLQALDGNFAHSYRVASHEIAAYLDPKDPKTFLGSTRLGIKSIAMIKQLAEEAFWESKENPEDKRETFSKISDACQTARHLIFQAEALAALLVQKGVPHTTVQAAFEISTISNLSDIRGAFSITNEELQDFIPQTVIGALKAWKTGEEIEAQIQGFLDADQRSHALLAETMTGISPLLREDPILCEALERTSSNRLTSIALTGDVSAISNVDLFDVVAFSGQIKDIIAAQTKVAIASESFGAAELLVNYDLNRIEQNTHRFVATLEALNDGLSIYNASIPDTVLFTCERWASRTREAIRGKLITEIDTLNDYSRKVLCLIDDGLDKLIRGINRNYFSDSLFEIDPPLLASPTATVVPDGERVRRDSIKEFIRSNSISHPAWLTFERTALNELILPEDLEHLLLVTRHTDRLDVAYYALRRAHGFITENPVYLKDYPSLTTFLAHRALITADAIKRFSTSHAEICSEIAADLTPSH